MTDTLVKEKKKIPNIKRPRIRAVERPLPGFSKGEETFNMISHIVGAAFGVAALILCVVTAAMHGNTLGIISGALYGFSMIMVYTISSVYHGLSPIKKEKSKKIIRVVDHCDIYGLILGSYLPIALTGFREYNATIAYIVLGFVAITCIVGIIFTAIDFTKFSVISNTCYFLAGWCIVLTFYPLLKAFPIGFIAWLLGGGIVYTLGMIFYVSKKEYSHSIFHLFILGGSVLQFVGIYLYCM